MYTPGGIRIMKWNKIMDCVAAIQESNISGPTTLTTARPAQEAHNKCVRYTGSEEPPFHAARVTI